ncbi:3-beta hydroxysteroid dehydrogenase/isomerase family [Aspergillus sp. HF37]|nr:3-beta hydroxysteroid dehydrogenase/isomerase family [Aspergillus sp. HF37]
MSKLITVFGATGNQGGSVIQHILADPQLSAEFKIRGVTRDTTKPAAQKLAERGVEVVSADLNSPTSLETVLQGTHTVFLVTNYWEYHSGETEFAQGKYVTDVASAVGVSHLIFSSLVHVTEATDGRLTHLPHFDSKAEIERYIRQSGLDATFVLPGYFMSNYLMMLRKSEGEGEGEGEYRLFYPVDGQKAKFPLFDAASDTGLFVKAAIKHADQLKGQRLLAASRYYTADEIIQTFSGVTSKKATFVQVTADQFKAAFPESMATEFLENHLFIEDPGYYLGQPLEGSQELLDSKPTDWAQFVRDHLSAWP